jgi:HAD superfamily hydrolase (TIGR01662 family)
MNSHPGSPADLDEILARSRYLFIDFDGTICSLFAGTPTQLIADRLLGLISSDHPAPATRDWSGILAYAHAIDPEAAARVADELTRIESSAVPTARPTAYAHDVITACRESGRGVAIISNNSERAVRSYLDAHGLASQVALVAARTDSDPAKLKPSLYLIEQATKALGISPAECAMVGDSIADIDAALNAGTRAIGYAPVQADADRLTKAGAQAIVSTMANLTLRLRARRPPDDVQPA